ncbi:MAG: hypothetical protein PWP27_1144 [Clostridiales bacterium]|jgi:N-acetylmuramoyl-L-alanine amidase|nr:hypothetical protein [Clostridiales bacterium]
MNLLKHIIAGLIIVIVLFSSMTISVLAEEVTYGMVTGSCVNIREEPNTSSRILGQLYRGEKIKVLGKSGNWVKMSYGDTIQGWMYGAYVDIRNQAVSRSGANIDRNIGADIVAYSENFLGVPYVYGGTSPKGFDCSGFAQYVFKHFGIDINRVAADQTRNGQKVSKGELLPGDLVFFDTNGKVNGEITHVGIYIGENKFIHASSPGSDVKISDLSTGYYNLRYITARRIVN